MGERGRLGSTEVMDAEAASPEGQPQTQCPMVLYKHTKTLSLSLSPMENEVLKYVSLKKMVGILVLSW